MRYLKKFWQEFKETTLYSYGFLMHDSEEIRRAVKHRMAITNCKRIMFLYPIILIGAMYVFSLLPYFRSEKLQRMSFKAEVTLILMATIYVGIIIYILYLNKIDNDEEIWKCKILYRSFWLIYIVLAYMVSMSLIIEFKIGLMFMGMCIIFCIAPLYETADFIGSLVIMAVGVYIATRRLDLLPGENVFLVNSIMAMLIVGYIAQRLEVSLRVLKEYVGVTAFLDPLTGLLNRRGATMMLKREFYEASKDNNVGALMVDIDFFKKYNDCYGHDEGDVCLKKVADCIKKTFHGKTKIMIRQGGEEFILLFIGTGPEEIVEHGEALREAIFAMQLEAPYKEVADYVTVSIGASVCECKKAFDFEELVKIADEGLYQAKEDGRNRVVYKEHH